MTAFSPREDCALLRSALECAGVEVRFERCENGGLVRVAGRYELFIPIQSTEKQQIELYVNSLKKIETSRLHLQPRVRRLLGEEDWNE